EDGIRDLTVTGVQTCALPIWAERGETIFPVYSFEWLGGSVLVRGAERQHAVLDVRLRQRHLLRNSVLRCVLPGPAREHGLRCSKIGRASCRERGRCLLDEGNM